MLVVLSVLSMAIGNLARRIAHEHKRCSRTRHLAHGFIASGLSGIVGGNALSADEA